VLLKEEEVAGEQQVFVGESCEPAQSIKFKKMNQESYLSIVLNLLVERQGQKMKTNLLLPNQ
jgi:hypothetical protein